MQCQRTTIAVELLMHNHIHAYETMDSYPKNDFYTNEMVQAENHLNSTLLVQLNTNFLQTQILHATRKLVRSSWPAQSNQGGF